MKLTALLLLLAPTATAFLPAWHGIQARRAQQMVMNAQRSDWQNTPSPLKALVSAATTGLNLVAGVSGKKDEKAVAQVPRAPVSPSELLSLVRKDYTNNCYFLTGDITDKAYDDDCEFTDPTISFRGLGVWKRNIASLKLFIRQPKILLRDIVLDRKSSCLRTKWTLQCELALPWRPVIDVDGATVHRYDPNRGNRIVSHEESWEVSALEAVGQIFRAGPSSSLPFTSRSFASMSLALLATGWFQPLGPSGGNIMVGDRAVTVASNMAMAAEERRVLAEIPASGIIFKDIITLEAFPDPKVDGVTLYVSDFQRPITERITKNFFSDPSQASITCARTGPVVLRDINKGKEGEEVFSEARSLLFKTIRVRRVYDPAKNVVVYVSYSTRLSKNDDENKSRFKSSLCAIPVDSTSSSTD